MNKLLILGTVGRDVEVKQLSPTNRMAKFSVAINADWKDSNGAWQKKTEWVNVVAWGSLADRCQEMLTKGSKVFIEGEIETKSYEKNGNKVYATHCKALKIQPIVYMKKQEAAPEDDLDQFLSGARSGESLVNEEIPF
jgi:single-strand DNA-binding protein